jgi:rubrerythrin
MLESPIDAFDIFAEVARELGDDAALEDLASLRQNIRAAEKRTAPYLARLLDTNSARLTNDRIDRVRESGRRLRSDLARLLREVTRTVARAIERATAARLAGDGAVRQELGRLAALETRVRAVEVWSRPGM